MEFKVNQVFLTKNVVGNIHELKILAIADKWIMCKFSRCQPFVKSIKEFSAFLDSHEGKLKIVRNKK